MIVESNSDKFLKSFMDFQKVFERKLNNVVRGFAYIITEEAIAKTPLGDSQAFMDRYIERQQSIGLNPQEGFARGSWQVNSSSAFTVQTLYGVNTNEQALTIAKTKLEGITFRDSVFIGNRGYYIKMLENNWSPQTNQLGITQPTMQAVLQVYKVSIPQLYAKG